MQIGQQHENVIVSSKSHDDCGFGILSVVLTTHRRFCRLLAIGYRRCNGMRQNLGQLCGLWTFVRWFNSVLCVQAMERMLSQTADRSYQPPSFATANSCVDTQSLRLAKAFHTMRSTKPW